MGWGFAGGLPDNQVGQRTILPLDAPPGASIGGDTGTAWQPPGYSWSWANPEKCDLLAADAGAAGDRRFARTTAFAAAFDAARYAASWTAVRGSGAIRGKSESLLTWFSL